MGNKFEDCKFSGQDRIYRSFREDPNDPNCSVQAVCIVGETNSGGMDVEKQLLCDVQADGSRVLFYRHFVYDSVDGTLSSSFDTDLAGTSYTTTGDVLQISDKKPELAIISCESIDITDASTESLNVPAQSTFAEMQVIGGTVYWSIDPAMTPTSDGSMGFITNDCGVLKLGMGIGTESGDVAELNNFSVIAAQGDSPRIQVCYYAVAEA